MDMVPREEFEAIKEIAQRARTEQEDLTVKVAALEQQLAAMAGASAKARKPRATKAAARPAKAAAKPATRRRRTDAKPAD
jgi:BMFP domain-containing protein YqiC